MKRRLLSAGAVTVLLIGGALFWWHAQYHPIDVAVGDVSSVRLEPIPEGSGSPIFEANPTDPGALPIGLIADAIPSPLPGPGVQPFGCNIGGDLIIELKDGRIITYGPCRHPRAILALWYRIIATVGHCTMPCGPTR